MKMGGLLEVDSDSIDLCAPEVQKELMEALGSAQCRVRELKYVGSGKGEVECSVCACVCLSRSSEGWGSLVFFPLSSDGWDCFAFIFDLSISLFFASGWGVASLELQAARRWQRFCRRPCNLVAARVRMR